MNDNLNMRVEKLAKLEKLEKLENPRFDSEDASSSYVKHDTFYLDEVYFVFDATIFKFPRAYLQDSPVFQQLFGSITLNSDNQGGVFTGDGSPLKPFTCNAVKKDVFALLLRLSRENSNYFTSQVKKEEWKDILELASQWRMEKVMTLAVSHLSLAKLDAITKLELARRHSIQDKEWRFSAIRELVKDNRLLTEGQAYLIGYDVALRIARLQGMVHARSKPSLNDDDDWKTLVDRLTKEGILQQKARYVEMSLGLLPRCSFRSIASSGQPSFFTAAMVLMLTFAILLTLSPKP